MYAKHMAKQKDGLDNTLFRKAQNLVRGGGGLGSSTAPGSDYILIKSSFVITDCHLFTRLKFMKFVFIFVIVSGHKYRCFLCYLILMHMLPSFGFSGGFSPGCNVRAFSGRLISHKPTRPTAGVLDDTSHLNSEFVSVMCFQLSNSIKGVFCPRLLPHDGHADMAARLVSCWCGNPSV